MDQRVHQVRLTQWSQRIIDRKNSGLTIAQWCEVNGFTKDTYHYWQKRVRAAALDSASTSAAIGSSTNDSALVAQGTSQAFAELPQLSGTKQTAYVRSSGSSALPGFCPAAVTIRRGSTVIEISNDADGRLLSFISGVIRNAE
jgi:hypothetical protein